MVSVSVLLNMNILPDNLCEVTLTLLAWSKFYKRFVFFRLIFALGLIFMFSALSYLGCILWDICWIAYLFGEDNHNYLWGELWSNLPLRFVAWNSEVLALYMSLHDDVIKLKHFPRYWPFVRGIHWSPVNSPHKGQWRGALMFSLICVWINGSVNNREAGD